MISLSALDLGLAASLVLILALLSKRMQLGLEGQLLIAATRTVIQLLLIGLVLESLFSHVNLLWIALMATGKPATVKQYLKELPADRREIISKVRDVIVAIDEHAMGHSELALIGTKIAPRSDEMAVSTPAGYRVLRATKQPDSVL